MDGEILQYDALGQFSCGLLDIVAQCKYMLPVISIRSCVLYVQVLWLSCYFLCATLIFVEMILEVPVASQVTRNPEGDGSP